MYLCLCMYAGIHVCITYLYFFRMIANKITVAVKLAADSPTINGTARIHRMDTYNQCTSHYTGVYRNIAVLSVILECVYIFG